jgi:hypothetical protein
MSMSKPAQMLVRLLERRSLYEEGAESVKGCEHLAYQLFLLIREHHGNAEARRIFAMWGNPPTAKRLALIQNIGLLDRHRMPKPNIQKLARQLAKENKALPRAKQRGAGSTDPITLEKQIRRVRDFRKAHMKKGTWLGPIPDAS